MSFLSIRVFEAVGRPLLNCYRHFGGPFVSVTKFMKTCRLFRGEGNQRIYSVTYCERVWTAVTKFE
jgi:hypothetical protein